MDYIISYDIKDDKIRNIVFNELRYLGFKNIQKSVFLGKDIDNNVLNLTLKFLEDLEIDSYFLTKIDFNKMTTNIKELLEKEEDIIVV